MNVGRSQIKDPNPAKKTMFHERVISVINLEDSPRREAQVWLQTTKSWSPCRELNPDLMSESHIF